MAPFLFYGHSGERAGPDRRPLDALGRTDTRGVWRVAAASTDILVVLVDICQDAATLGGPGGQLLFAHRSVFIIGNAVDYQHRLPARATTFRLADIVLGEAKPVLLRELRHLIGEARQSPLDLPAIAMISSMTLPLAASASTSAAQPPFRLLAGTQWGQVSIYLVDGDTIAVHAREQRLHRYRFYELGLSDGRSGKPSKKWRILESLCENYGQLHWTGAARDFGAFKEQVSGLRQHLQRAFRIAADPLPTCSRSHGLRAAFRAFPDLAGAPPFEDRAGP